MTSDRRSHHCRKMLNALVQITWQDRRGEIRYFQARTIDISDGGLRIELPEAIGKSTRVQLRSELLRLACPGNVRSCTRAGFNYVIGIEFNREVRGQAD
jgi:hypothetical protein